MTLPPAALPGMRQQAPVEHKPHPGADRLLGCPACGGTDQLVLDVPAVVHHRVRLTGIDGITEPEVEIIEADALAVDEEVPGRATKLRCLACRWSYTGPQPLARATAPTPK